ncbi:lipoprotein-releasing ABC transporter permease subunit [Pelagibius sp. Alg239-R121]|uniref:lipoprotein-releasing ABC transporter permease subunit n=1 Tax=Pelagibius sp. Alg239-R121 TaxID=2993448 RepID=UPI0024A7748A|nr:lipoprotein-releasing ABC transporter permease subunit [Pelagibius sp. Alg239-R121]
MIFDAFERLVAMRYLRTRRKEGFISVIAWISLIGIALGVATLIIVMAVMNGFREELLGRILGVNGHLTLYGTSRPITDYADVSERVRALTGIHSVNPQVQGEVMVTARSVATGGLVRGMIGDDLRSRSLIADNIVSGSIEKFGGDDGVAIGRRLANKLGLRVGDRVNLVSPNGNTTVMGTVPRMKAYRIDALFEVGMFEYDSSFIYMPIPAAQLFFRLPEQANAIEVFLDDPDQMKTVLPEIMAAAGEGLQSRDWQRANSTFFNAIQVERNVMFFILSLIILVAAFNILSGQFMLVKDKGRDIAILRTMGATQGQIMRIFFLSGASIGVVGTIAGFILGVAFSSNIDTIKQWLENLSGARLFQAEIYFLSKLPAIVDPVEVVQVLGIAIVLSFLAPLFPAWRAARLDPVEALRYE